MTCGHMTIEERIGDIDARSGYSKRVGNPVEFDCLEKRGTKARTILLQAAPKNNDSGLQDVSSEVEKILDWCAGLPLALSIAGSAIIVCEETPDDASLAINEYCKSKEEVPEEFFEDRDMNDDDFHPGLPYVASLKLCEKWEADMRNRFEALCVLGGTN